MKNNFQKIHYFQDSNSRAFEEEIDNILLSNSIGLTKVDMSYQRRGIDRLAVEGEDEYTLEYKADSKVFKTGNFFLETVSQDTSNKPGWVYYSEADYIVYFLPTVKQLWFIKTATLKNNIEDWKQKYPIKSCKNKTYSSYGVLVPRGIIFSIVNRIISF